MHLSNMLGNLVPLIKWKCGSKLFSIWGRIQSCRTLFFSSVKKLFLDCIVDATTTPTPLSHDEYELPREVRTVRVNRLKARHAMSSEDLISKRKHSAFSQL